MASSIALAQAFTVIFGGILGFGIGMDPIGRVIADSRHPISRLLM